MKPRRYSALALTLVLVLAFASRAGAPPHRGLTRGQADSVQAAVRAKMAERHIPGLQIAIVHAGEIRHMQSFGVANLETREPVTDETLFRIASSTKPITATAAMQLVEKGKLDLDAPVQRYAPKFSEKKYPVTTRQLITHTSGIRNYRRNEGERTDHFDHLSDALVIFNEDSLEFEPGTKYRYSVFGYTLLGVVIEGASGQTFAEYVRANIFAPSGMGRSQPDHPGATRAQGYTPKDYAVFNGNYRHGIPMDSSYKLPAGGFLSTATDMAKFAIAVMDGKLIEPETLALMSAEQTVRDGTKTGYGYGWYAGGKREPPGSIWHGGVQSGFTAEVWLVPKERFAVVILVNLEGGGALGLEDLANKVHAIVQN